MLPALLLGLLAQLPPPLQAEEPALSVLPGCRGGYARNAADGGWQLAGSYGEAVTFARDSTSTCLNPDTHVIRPLLSGEPCVDGCGIKSRPETTNLILRNNDFSNAAWTKGNITVPSCTAVAPDGTATACRIQEDTAGLGSYHYALQNVTFAENTTYTKSVYAKAGERTWIEMQVRTLDNTWKHAYFNLGAGAVGSVSNTTATITSVGGGWYRCTMTFTSGTGVTTDIEAIYLSSGDNGADYVGDGASGAYFWGAQTEVGAVASDVCGPTAGTAGVCKAETGGSAAVVLGATPSLAATVTVASAVTGYVLEASSAAANRVSLRLAAGVPTCDITQTDGGVVTLAGDGGAIALNTRVRLSCSYDGVTQSVCGGGYCTREAKSFTPSGASATSRVGYDGIGGGSQFGGTVSDMCWSPSAWGCQ